MGNMRYRKVERARTMLERVVKTLGEQIETMDPSPERLALTGIRDQVFNQHDDLVHWQGDYA